MLPKLIHSLYRQTDRHVYIHRWTDYHMPLVGRGPTIASIDSLYHMYTCIILFHCATGFLQCLTNQSDCCVQAEGCSSRHSYSVRLETWSIMCSFVDFDKFVGERPEHGDKLSSGRKGCQYTCLPGLPWPTLAGKVEPLLSLVENVEQVRVYAWYPTIYRCNSWALPNYTCMHQGITMEMTIITY